MELFEKFLEVDPKISGKILKFIIGNCQVAASKLISINSKKIELKDLKKNIDNFIFKD